MRFTAEGGVVNVRATVPVNTDRLHIDVETSGRGLPDAYEAILLHRKEIAKSAPKMTAPLRTRSWSVESLRARCSKLTMRLPFRH